jgi:hypothetical protein
MSRTVYGAGPNKLDHNVDIVVAQLCTRFYHARLLIYHLFVYEALHMPERVTADDCTNCAFAIDAACLGTLPLSLRRDNKHFLPHLFSWT